MLPRLPSVRELIKLYGLSARSQLGQNFILDKNITDKIVRTAHLSQQTPLVVEVGPGPGLLTRSILDTGVNRIAAIEKDERFLPTLTQLAEASGGRLRIIHGNALEVSSSLHALAPLLPKDFSSPLHIMGNLPFNVASPLLIQWLHQSAAHEGLFKLGDVWMTLMFQKEVGERLAAPPSTEHRGRLSVMAQSLCSVNTVYQVPSTVFVPRPKVDAAVVQLKPLQTKLTGETYKTLEHVVRHYFTKRRKTVGHITKHLGKSLPQVAPLIPRIEELVDFKARPEDLSNEDFYQIACIFHNHGIHSL
ncbi:S-adenosyl-L-methionine-dependent methyltransferase [Lichtheimia hyalospora FSU 10163]|nr:S-adenosyl-L-methionine-dependent methyltransferase [Lichtheimia hyalospora FSU 10163]